MADKQLHLVCATGCTTEKGCKNNQEVAEKHLNHKKRQSKRKCNEHQSFLLNINQLQHNWIWHELPEVIRMVVIFTIQNEVHFSKLSKAGIQTSLLKNTERTLAS